MGITPAQRKQSEADFGIKFENDAEAMKATAAVQRYLKSHGYEELGTFKDVESGKSTGVDGVDGSKTHKMIQKFVAENTEGSRTLQDIAKAAIAKPAPPAPVEPPKPLPPPKPEPKEVSDAEKYSKALNFVYYGGPQANPAIKDGTNADTHLVELHKIPRAGLAPNVIRLEMAYKKTRTALLEKIDAQLKIASTNKDPNTVQRAGMYANALAAQVSALDREAENLRTNDKKNASGADVASQAFALRLRYLQPVSGIAEDDKLVAALGGNTEQVLGFQPAAKDFVNPKRPVEQVAFVANSPASFSSSGKYVGDKLVVTPNKDYSATTMTDGFYDFMRNVYTGFPALSRSQFLHFIEITPGLSEQFKNWQAGKETTLPITLIAIAAWNTGGKADAAKPAAA